MRTMVIGCDNAAVSMKELLITFLEAKGIKVENMGCDSPKVRKILALEAANLK